MKNNIHIVSIHHRRAPLFEEGMKLLWENDYRNITILETGNQSIGSYNGPCKNYYVPNSSLSYDKAMVFIKSHFLPKIEDDNIVLFIDNDLFLKDIEYINNIINEFILAEYGYCSYFVEEKKYTDPHYLLNNYNNNYINAVKNQSFTSDNSPFGFVPEPHYENAFLLINANCWNRLSDFDVGNTRRLWKSLWDITQHNGVLKVKHKLRFSHHTSAWFHFGNLMAFHYKLEQNKDFDPESVIDMSRLGYLNMSQDRYKWLPKNLLNNLNAINNKCGKDNSLNHWNELIKNTCLEKEYTCTV